MIDNRFIIVVAGRNNAAFVKQNLESILAQDYPNYKIAFFDDASDDGTAELAMEILGVKKARATFTRSKTSTTSGLTPEVSLTLEKTRQYKTWYFANLEKEITINDTDILVFLDGDDFLACENVLSYLNEVYKQSNCWMTYGGMLVWNGGEDYVEPFPQNSEIPEQVKRERLYRRDMWRTSHLKTMRGFLWKHIDKRDLMPDGKAMVGPDDLAIMFAALEMCPPDRIYRVKDSLYIYNHSQANQHSRAFTEHKATGIDYEGMVRSREPYKQLAVVSPTLAGGLGNQMFEVAAAASLAKDNNALLVINPDEHILPNQGRNVKNYLSNIFSKIVADPQPQVKTMYAWEHASYEPIPYSPNVKLRGHYQSYKYFHHNRIYITDLFKPLVNWLTKPDDDVAAIQVRRGDYWKFPDHHPQLPASYFVNAVKLAEVSKVVIYSDDHKWCQENLKFDGVEIEYKKCESDWQELLEMSTYKKLIISNSSFGWWAAYLQTPSPQRHTFVPSVWFGPAIVNDGFKMEDLILPDWDIVQI
jgi:glycosyltransferase involved in cell wall biosynthesis